MIGVAKELGSCDAAILAEVVSRTRTGSMHVLSQSKSFIWTRESVLVLEVVLVASVLVGALLSTYTRSFTLCVQFLFHPTHASAVRGPFSVPFILLI